MLNNSVCSQVECPEHFEVKSPEYGCTRYVKPVNCVYCFNLFYIGALYELNPQCSAV